MGKVTRRPAKPGELAGETGVVLMGGSKRPEPGPPEHGQRADTAGLGKAATSPSDAPSERRVEPDSALLIRAASFAAIKHRDQRRKGAHASPYINHCLRVAELVATVGDVTDTAILAAAILHDTIEDTKTPAVELQSEFGVRVRDLVAELTDDKTLKKDVRKRLQIEHAHHLSTDAIPIKLADKIANVEDVTDSPPADWSHQRRVEYVDWAEAVVNNCPPANERLLDAFRWAVARARQALLGERRPV